MNKILAAITVAALCVVGCKDQSGSMNSSGSMSESHVHSMVMMNIDHAIAVMHPTSGSTVMGTVHFMQKGDSVAVSGDITGLSPNTMHGFHIHEFGDCSSTDGSSAGGHYAGAGHKHGRPEDAPSDRHAGDMGNINADGSGKAHIDVTLSGLRVNDILGRAVIVHGKPDDFSQPTGNAGNRIACGVIGVAK